MEKQPAFSHTSDMLKRLIDHRSNKDFHFHCGNSIKIRNNDFP
jgi:hypothetical protein